MTHHCPRSNWTGPESELRRGICPKCAVTTLYENCEVRPLAITFTDGEGRTRVLVIGYCNPETLEDRCLGADERYATTADLALAGYEPTTQALDRLTLKAAIIADDTRRELEALRKLERLVRAMHNREELTCNLGRLYEVRDLLKAIDEARK